MIISAKATAIKTAAPPPPTPIIQVGTPLPEGVTSDIELLVTEAAGQVTVDPTTMGVPMLFH